MTLSGIGRLLIDGNNLLHRVAGSADPAAQRLLLARLNAALPPTLPTVMMLDGHAAAGTNRRQRLRRGLEVHHSGSISADDALVNLVRETIPPERGQVTLVSDDRALVERARHMGARTQRLDWLASLLETSPTGGSGASIGGRKPAAARRELEPEEERQPWQPGRGATRKKGNPRHASRKDGR